jgi:hypothetical protein
MEPYELARLFTARRVTGCSALADDRLTLYLDDGTFVVITAHVSYPYEHAVLEYFHVDPMGAS